MADAATKHFSNNVGGNSLIIKDLKGLISHLKTRRSSVAFAYGFTLAFVAFTVFLAFNPSPNSSSPWFINIFTTTSPSSPSPPSSFRSQFPSIFSYIFPNNSSPPHTGASPFPLHNSTTESNGTLFSQPPKIEKQEKQPPSSKNLTQTAKGALKPTVLQPNQSTNASILSKDRSFGNNLTQITKDEAIKPNQTTVAAPKRPPSVEPSKITKAANQSGNSTTNSVSLGKGNSGNKEKGVEVKNNPSNFTVSLSKEQINWTKQSNRSHSGKQGIENLVEGLMNCDLFDGEWVKDDSYPLYKPGSCSLIDEQFNCILNGRPDKDFQKYKWKPKGCTLPRLNPGRMMDLLRGKRLVFVGDSLNRNMWESLVCILKGSVKDQKKVFEANGRHHFKGEASYSFIFKDYNFTVEFFVSPFLVQEWEMPDKNGGTKETLRLDLVGRSSDQYKAADIIVFNTGHWWTHEKTSLGKDYYQEGSHIYNDLNVLEAFRKALTTWARWVDANINPSKSLVLFRGYSASHFSGGQWNSGGACDSEVAPIKNATYLKEYPPKMLVLERVLRGMKTHITYLNITRMTDYRKDGHPSIYRKQNLPEEERRSPLLYQDCSHWCLPGVPDAWNEILYAELLINENRKQQVQKRHR